MKNPLALCLLTLFLSYSTALSQSPQPRIAECSIEDAARMIGDNKGSIVVFHLYASWCRPCRDEIPALIRICERYKNHPFRMLAFSVDRNDADLQTFLTAQKVNFEHRRFSAALTSQSHSPLRALGINYSNSIPYTAVFDTSGKLIKQWSGAKAHASYVTILDEAYLAAPPAEAKDPAPLPPVAQKPEPAKVIVSPPVAVAKPRPQASAGSSWRTKLLVVLSLVGITVAAALVVYFKRKNHSYSAAERLRWRLNN